MTDNPGTLTRRAFAGSALLVGGLATSLARLEAPGTYRWDIVSMDAG